MSARRRDDSTSHYVLIGAVGLIILAGGALSFAMLRGKQSSRAKEPTPSTPSAATPSTTSPSTQAAASTATAPQAATGQAPSAFDATYSASEKPIVIGGDVLRQEVVTNESSADAKYKNKPLDVTGTISMVLTEPPLVGVFFGTPQDPAPPIMCDMSRKQNNLSLLRPGQTITVRGVYLGKQADGSIGLGDCAIVKK